MTSKEKAIELIDEFKSMDIDYIDSIEGVCFMCMSKEDAKQCALIVVNNILKIEIIKDSIDNYYLKYWEQVKNEIENL
jgi:hypothetical protein